MLVNYFILALIFTLAICTLYILYKVAEAYLLEKKRKNNTWRLNESSGTWVFYIFNGREMKEQVLISGFKPVFTHFPETGEIVFKDVRGYQYRVHTDQWVLIDVPDDGGDEQ